MDITWLGHACFRLRGREAALVTDPFARTLGLTLGRQSADVITVSHDAPHHAAADQIAGEPRVIRGPGEYEIAGIMITGVATWDDVNPKSTQFSIFVYGLSNGWAVVDGPDGKPIVRRKTLQLKFKRLGDDKTASSDQVRYVGHDWIYATAELPENNPDLQKLLDEKKPATPPAPPKDEKSGQPGDGR